jgi:hypothetical protein
MLFYILSSSQAYRSSTAFSKFLAPNVTISHDTGNGQLVVVGGTAPPSINYQLIVLNF